MNQFKYLLQITLCKDGDGRVGVRVKDINKGIFVCLVKKNSPAALAGRFFLYFYTGDSQRADKMHYISF